MEEKDERKENALPAGPAPKKDFIRSAKDFMNGVLSPLKGKELSQLVEDFTAQMTLVAEGLSEDQQRLSDEADRLAAQQTELEQTLLDRLHDAEAAQAELRKDLARLNVRVEKAEKAAEKKARKAEGLSALLRQATWLAAIVAGAWVLVTLINFFRK